MTQFFEFYFYNKNKKFIFVEFANKVIMMPSFTENSYQSAPFTIVLPAYFRRIKENWFNLFVLGLLIHLLFQKDITIRFQLHDREMAVPERTLNETELLPHVQNTSAVWPLSSVEQVPSPRVKTKVTDRRANDFSNLTFVLNPAYARQKGVPPEIVAEKLANCRQYVDRYVGEAQREMQQHGIPASITLAQGLLESNAGDSRLARESNNHFGIKCRSKCRGCTCRNYTDDDIYDMFRVFENPLASYAEHSQLLSSKRYAHLAQLGRKNFRGWAHGLKRAGYATDKRYAEKLIRIIETLELDRYDS